MTPSGSLPRAEISLGVLSALAAAAAGGELADLRGDAFGHGACEVAPTLRDAGIRRFLVEDSADLRGAGFDAVTTGVPDVDTAALYGLPGSGVVPALTLSGRILSRKILRAGEAVSYGYTYRAAQDTTIALVTGGYAQGIVRALGNRAQVEAAGVLRPIVGRVAMDVCVIDLQTTEPDETDEVVFFGGTGPARDALSTWAHATGLRMTELLAVAGMKAERQWMP